MPKNVDQIQKHASPKFSRGHNHALRIALNTGKL